MKPDKLPKIAVEHAERVYSIAIDKIYREQDAWAKLQAKEQKQLKDKAKRIVK